MAILSTGRRDGPIRVRVRLFLHVALRLADQVGLGVDVSRSRCGKHLHVLPDASTARRHYEDAGDSVETPEVAVSTEFKVSTEVAVPCSTSRSAQDDCRAADTVGQGLEFARWSNFHQQGRSLRLCGLPMQAVARMPEVRPTAAVAATMGE